MDSPVSQIKEKLSIEEVISSYIKLEKAGANFKAKCPFHSEKTPSFFISPNRNSYYCFGCGAKGDIFTFIEEFEGVDFKGALKILAEKAGISLTQFSSSDFDQKDILYKIMEESTLYFYQNLKQNINALNYLKNRGLDENSISMFRVGFAKDSWRELLTYLKSKGYKEEDIEKVGLIKKTEKGFYDRFRSRIIFPLFDSSGRVIAFSGRIFESSEEREGFSPAKYLNSPETPIFNKSAVLYGLNFAKDSIRKNNFVILVEGQMDLVLSHQSGFRNTIATSGTALSENIMNDDSVSNLGIVRRLTSNIVLAFDGDNAGFNATLKAGKIALLFNMDTKVASLKDGVDPADLISKDGKEEWKNVIKNAKHIIDFLLQKIIEEIDDERKLGKEIKEKVLPFVAYLESQIERNFFLKKISDASGIPFMILEEDFKKIYLDFKNNQGKLENKNEENIVEELLRKDFILKRLLGILFWQENIANSQIDFQFFLKEVLDILSVDKDFLDKILKDRKEEMIYEAEVFYKEKENIEYEIKNLILNLREEILKEELGKKLKELYLAEKEKDKEKTSNILKEYQNIINKIENLKKEIN